MELPSVILSLGFIRQLSLCGHRIESGKIPGWNEYNVVGSDAIVSTLVHRFLNNWTKYAGYFFQSAIQKT